MCSYSISTLQAKCIQRCIHPQKTLLSRGRKPLRSRPLQPHNFFSCRCLSHTCTRRWHAGSPEYQGRKKTENTFILKQTRNYSQIRQLKIIPFPTCNIFQHCATLPLPKLAKDTTNVHRFGHPPYHQKKTSHEPLKKHLTFHYTCS